MNILNQSLDNILTRYVFHTDRSRLQQLLFEINIRRNSYQLLNIVLLLIAGLNLLAWPTDFIYFDDTRLINVYIVWRTMLMIFVFSVLFTLKQSDAIRRHLFSFTYFAFAIVLIISGFLFGSIRSLHTPWFYLVYLLPMCTTIFGFKIIPRIFSTIFIPLCYTGSYFFMNHLYLDKKTLAYKHFDVTLNLIVSTIILSILIGHLIHHLNRSNFFRDRNLEISRQKIKRLAAHDQLTGLLNRREFQERTENELERSKRYGLVFSILMLDLDHFKSINDTYGHAFGDEVLESVGSLINEEIRTTDLGARYGGEEFCILLSESTLDEAYQFCERLRKKISNLSFEPSGNSSLNVTCSMGVTEFNDRDASLQNLLNQADEALYEAKEMGRNQVRKFK